MSNIFNKSPAEISNYLKSGAYIPDKVRLLLEEKLQNNSKIQHFNNNYLNLKPLPKKVSDLNINNYPSLNARTQLRNNGGAGTSVRLSKLKFNECFNETQKVKNNIFNNQQIVIDHADLIEAYNLFGIHRIRIQYIINNRIINLIKMLTMSGEQQCDKCDRILTLKNRLKYDRTIKNVEQLKECMINITSLHEISDIYTMLIRLLNDCNDNLIICGASAAALEQFLSSKKEELSNAEDRLGKSFVEIKMFGLKNQDLLNEVNEHHDYILQIMHNIPRTKYCIDPVLDEMAEMQNNVHDLISNIIQSNDPHTYCQYHVSIVNNKRNPIVIEGIKNNIYLRCDDDIDDDCQLLDLDDEYLKQASIDEIESLVTDGNFECEKNCLNIKNIDGKGRRADILYDLKENIPWHTGRIKIVNKLHQISVLSTTVTNKLCEPTSNYKIIAPVEAMRYKQKYFLNKHSELNVNVASSMHESAHALFTNELAIEHIFDTITQHSESDSIINLHMLASFKKLAFETSI